MADEASSLTLDAVITLLRARCDIDDRGRDILAAAYTMRDESGRDRKNSIRSLLTSREVSRREKINGKWKDRKIETVARELERTISVAASHWLQKSAGDEPEQRGVGEHPLSSPTSGVAEPAGDEPGQRGVEEHALSSPTSGVAEPARSTSCSVATSEERSGAGHGKPTIEAMPESQENVVSLRRLGFDLFRLPRDLGRCGEVIRLCWRPYLKAPRSSPL